MSMVELSAPWVGYSRAIEAMFGPDPEITTSYSDENNEIKIYVNNPSKADALSKLFPAEKTFGNVTLRITVIPANDAKETKASLFLRAFSGNPNFEGAEKCPDLFNNELWYFGFVNSVVQYFDDRLDDPYGLRSVLLEDLARELFDDTEGVFFYTELPREYDVSALTGNE